jgi:hypothetical protein
MQGFFEVCARVTGPAPGGAAISGTLGMNAGIGGRGAGEAGMDVTVCPPSALSCRRGAVGAGAASVAGVSAERRNHLLRGRAAAPASPPRSRDIAKEAADARGVRRRVAAIRVGAQRVGPVREGAVCETRSHADN